MPVAALWPLPPPSPIVQAALPATGARSEADYLGAIQALLPRGRAWSRDPATTLTAVLDGWARAYARVDARQTNLLTDAFPTTAIELLPEWEATLGLPDPCLGALPTLQQRQTQVYARLVAMGGQSIPYLTMVAASLGFPVGITEFAPFRAGVNHAGDAINGSQAAQPGGFFLAGAGVAGTPVVIWDGGTQGFDWSFALLVNATAEPMTFFRAGLSAADEPIASWLDSAALATISYFAAGLNDAGDPVASWGAPLLECELRRIAPAETTMIFAYGA